MTNRAKLPDAQPHLKVSTGSVETRWLGGSFLMVCRNTLAGWVLASSVCV